MNQPLLDGIPIQCAAQFCFYCLLFLRPNNMETIAKFARPITIENRRLIDELLAIDELRRTSFNSLTNDCFTGTFRYQSELQCLSTLKQSSLMEYFSIARAYARSHAASR
ncbi:hypothetical protein [Burkholderia sp. ABCPW 14]|uniref:hypothetical protein n=1 Tax=Burkholderia sp. ABCPW 14 TaxID=1637860 RepID=UPI0012E33FF4|nr:hypothetical protein [Burkholderia sp. ABCPW 14]